MTSLLRSTKFMRYFAGAARTLLLNSQRTAEVGLLAAPKHLCVANNVLLRDYATSKKSESLEPLLQKLDTEVKKFGRISKRDIDEVFNEIKAKSDITSSQSLLVIRCCGELVPEEPPEHRTLLVQKIWSVLTEIGVPMDISHYNALLRVYIENEHPFSPAAFLEELEKKGLEPNRVTYQRLMWRYCQEGDVDGATKVLEKMRELSMPVSEPVLNALVMGYSYLGDTDGAKAVIDTMAGAGLQPSDSTYTLLACGYAKKGDFVGILDTLKASGDKDIFLSNKNILDIIEAYVGSGQSEKMDDLLELLKPNSAGYNQDCYNSILRLINKGHVEAAKEVMKTMSRRSDSAQTLYQGHFFIKQLLKIHKEPQKIVQLCRELQQDSLISNAFFIATEVALQNGNSELALELFKELKNAESEIRPHFYWPLLVRKGKDNDEEGLLQLLSSMNSEGVVPTNETLREYVIPFIKAKDGQTIITKLQIAGVPITQAARCVMLTFLDSGMAKEASDVALRYRLYGQVASTKGALLLALSKNKDIKSFVSILHVLTTRYNTNATEADSAEDGQSDDKLYYEAYPVIKSAIRTLVKPELCEQLLSALLAKGVSIDTATAEDIEQYLGENLTTPISELLAKLSSGDLKRIPIEGRPRVSYSDRSSLEIEKLLEKAKSKDGPYNRLQRSLLIAYTKENNVEKVNSFVEELKAENVDLSVSTKALLFEFYSVNNEIEKAMNLKKDIEEKHPDFMLNSHKLIEMAYALIRANRFEEAISFIENNKPIQMEDGAYQTNSRSWQMLNYLSEAKETAKVQQMTKLLIEKEYVEPSNVLLGPSIKVHLLNDDLEGALQSFEFCCKQYRCTPWKGELMKALILKEDANKLQWLADLSTQIHGEVNILHDLVLAFVECGRFRQARRILATPGLYPKQRRLENACQRYVQDGKSEHLEGLLEATKELSHIDRSYIFYHLLVSYCKANETDKALGLWTLLQEEGEVPSNEFLTYLGKYLREKGEKVPFVIPATKTKEKKEKSTLQERKEERTTPKTNVHNEEKQNISGDIDKCIENGKYSEAMRLVVDSFGKGFPPRQAQIKYLLKKLSETGDVATIKQLESKMTDDLRRGVNYDDKLTMALFVSGSAMHHIEDLHQKVLQAKDEEELKKVLVTFPRSNAFVVVGHDSQIMNKCKEIAELAATKGIYTPANILWMEYLVLGDHKSADDLWNKHLINSKLLLFKRILQHAFTANQIDLIEKVLQYLNTNENITNAAKALVYARLIGAHTENKDIVMAKAVLDTALSQGITLKEIGRTAVKLLKNQVEAVGENFKHEVPK